jgi:PIN domain nuclease of toxin-antitoxin system
MRILLDTHAFLWWLVGSASLPDRARQAIADRNNEILIGVGVLWEITIKRALRKLDFPHDLETVIRDEGFTVFGINLAHLRMLESMLPHHRDPFDRILIAQSLADHLPIVTGDRVFRAYGAMLLW